MRLIAWCLIWLVGFACAQPEHDDAGSTDCAGGKCDGVGDSCATSADCPAAAKFCVPRADGALTCQSTTEVDTGYAACGTVASNATGVGAPCNDGCARETTMCVDAPVLAASFCSMRCTADRECGAGAFCATISGTSGTVCIPYRCACEAVTAEGELLDDALSAVSRNSCDLGQRFGSIASIYPPAIASDAVRPTLFQELFHAPRAIPAANRRLRDDVLAARDNAAPVSGVVRIGARLWDEELHAASAPAPAPASFEDAVVALLGSEGPARRASIVADAADLPVALRAELAPIIATLADAIELRDRAIPDGADLARWWRAPMAMWEQQREVVPNSAKIDLTRTADRNFLLRDFEYQLLADAAVRIAEAVERANLTQSFAGTYFFTQETPWGRIVIRGTGNDIYRETSTALAGDLLLVVDTGGDDRYEVPVGGTTSPHNPLAIAIDLGGADTYTYVKVAATGDGNRRPPADAAGRRPTVPRHSLSEVRRQGAGSLGVGMLFDLGVARDRYESLRFSQGSGVLGVGVLYDEGGDDIYHAETTAQAAGQFGLGILIDGAGNDSYTGFSLVQGAVHVKAVGLLVDYAGNDDYWAGPGNAYVGRDAWIDGHDMFYEYGINQGASWGRRGDYPQDTIQNDGHASGGIGALIDLGGSDAYTCGAFCQGLGYWFGTGILYDDSGDDTYYGRIFAGGSGIHFGLGIRYDGSGNDDHYAADILGLELGSGDDLALGWFEDRGGDDRYGVSNKCGGSGSEKGTGVFIDLAGNDTYTASHHLGFGMSVDPTSMRAPASARYPLRTHGVFVDGGGVDTYARPAFFTPEPVANQRSWLHPWYVANGTNSGVIPSPLVYASPTVYGVGLDR
jgi:hypothetical protein